MSFYGVEIFEKNVRTIMNTKTFKKASMSERSKIGYRLLNSKYGVGRFSGPKELNEDNT